MADGRSEMKIAVLQIPNTYNYGSMMMAENIIHYLNARVKQAMFYVDVSSAEDLDRLRIATGMDNIVPLSDIKYVKESRSEEYCKIKQQLIWLKETMSLPNILVDGGIQQIIVLGGDNLTEGGAKYIPIVKRCVDFNKMSKEKIDIHLVGQTVGPFKKWKGTLPKLLLRQSNIFIYTRDEISHRYLKDELNIRNSKECADLAFLDLAKQTAVPQQETLSEYSLKKDGYVTIVPSGLWRVYGSNEERYVDMWCRIVEMLLADPAARRLKLVMLPHVLKPDEDDDRKMITRIEEKVGSDRLIAIHDGMYPYQARHILGGGVLTVSGRMHASVSTFQMGKPAISLSYSVKYAGVIGGGLGRNDLIIEVNDPKFHDTDKVVVELVKKVKYVLDDYSRLIEEIGQASGIMKELSVALIDNVAERMMEAKQ